MSVEINYGSQTYFVTRDSSYGKMSPKCDLWWLKPERSKVGTRVAWVAGDHDATGHFGEYDLETVREWFGTVPETDRELLVAERGVYADTESVAPVSTPKRARA